MLNVQKSAEVIQQVPFEVKDRISRSLEYDRERRNDRLWQKTLKTMAVRKEIMHNTRSFNRIWKERDSAQPRLLEAILYKDNFNRAYKRVKANKGAPGIDGMTIEEALPYLKEHQQEITDRIYRGKYTSVSSKTS